MNNKRFPLQRGFTLIEIVIALAIVSIAVLAISNAMRANTEMAANLEQRLLASWVASNQMALVRYQSQQGEVKAGTKTETVDMGGRTWRAKVNVKKTQVEKVFLVKIEVIDDANRDQPPLANLVSAITDRF